MSETSKQDRLESYKRGELRKPAHVNAMAAFSRAEVSLAGTRDRRRIRDVGVGVFRTVVLLAAVLLPNLEDPAQSDNAGASRPGDQTEDSKPREDIHNTLTLSVDVHNDPPEVQSSGDDETLVEVEIFEPLTLEYLKEDIQFVVTTRSDQWYRTELGVNDVFWALPRGDFFFKVKALEGCEDGGGIEMAGGEASRRVCSATLAFVFDARSSAQAGGSSTGSNGEASCGDAEVALSEYPNPVTCTYRNGDRGITVHVRRSQEQTEVAGKVAFDVKWCPTADEQKCPK